MVNSIIPNFKTVDNAELVGRRKTPRCYQICLNVNLILQCWINFHADRLFPLDVFFSEEWLVCSVNLSYYRLLLSFLCARRVRTSESDFIRGRQSQICVLKCYYQF